MTQQFRTKVYLAGPMTGLPHGNFPAFNAAAQNLRGKGYVVFNPAEVEDVMNKTYKECLKIDVDWIFEEAEAIAMLPGWETSNGARAEHALAVALKLKIMYLT
jgi:hypothetical protein